MSCSKWLFQQPNDIFVETGSGSGGGIDNALKYGFKEIHSIEINKQLYQYCLRKYKGNIKVNLYCGDSIEILPKILAKIDKKTTFLLDAHVMDVSTLHGKIICPVLEEIKMIITHAQSLKIKHSILVDDVKFFNGKVKAFGCIRVEDIKDVVDSIDSTYAFNVGRKSIWVI